MKKRHFFTLMIILVGICGGCEKGLEYRDVIFFTGTESSPDRKFTIDAPSGIGISVSSSAKMAEDVRVDIEIQSELVSGYNEKNGTNYEFLPPGSYELSSANVLIEEGTHVSEPAQLSVVTLDDFEEGITYLVPVTITKVSSGMDVLEASKTIYIIVNRTIITRAADLAGGNYFAIDFESDPNLSSVSALTTEIRVWVNSWQTHNPYISTVMGIEECWLLRFGDVSVENNRLQLAGGRVNDKKFPVSSNDLFTTGRWYHIAAVYNGSTVALYINGELNNYTDAEQGVVDLTFNYNGNFYIGYSAGGRYLDGYVSEARVWTRALTASELQNNLCYADPTSEGLLAYWRFNDALEGVVTDLTGNGYDAIAHEEITWVEGIRCPD
jgi:hypothetical protein